MPYVLTQKQLHKVELADNAHTRFLNRESQSCQVIRGRRRQKLLQISALHIDRRAHLERAWKRQQEAALAFDPRVMGSEPLEICNLAQLERVVEAAGSSIVAVGLYSRNVLVLLQSCGACKQMMKHFRDIAQEASSQRAGVKFLVHNVRDDFDDVTDLARLYRVKTVPCFIFFSGGALMKSMPMPDSRLDPGSIRKLMGSQAGMLSSVLREMLFRDTPSARR